MVWVNQEAMATIRSLTVEEGSRGHQRVVMGEGCNSLCWFVAWKMEDGGLQAKDFSPVGPVPNLLSPDP